MDAALASLLSARAGALAAGLEAALLAQDAPHYREAPAVRRLALVIGIVGRGKDELARAFLEHKERAEARAAILQQRLDELLKGTDGPPDV